MFSLTLPSSTNFQHRGSRSRPTRVGGPRWETIATESRDILVCALSPKVARINGEAGETTDVNDVRAVVIIV